MASSAVNSWPLENLTPFLRLKIHSPAVRWLEAFSELGVRFPS